MKNRSKLIKCFFFCIVFYRDIKFKILFWQRRKGYFVVLNLFSFVLSLYLHVFIRSVLFAKTTVRTRSRTHRTRWRTGADVSSVPCWERSAVHGAARPGTELTRSSTAPRTETPVRSHTYIWCIKITLTLYIKYVDTERSFKSNRSIYLKKNLSGTTFLQIYWL